MSGRYMTLGYYVGFDHHFKATYEVMDWQGQHVFGNSKEIKGLIQSGVMGHENDIEGLTRHLLSEGILYPRGSLIEGITLDRAVREPKVIELPLYDDEKQFGMAWKAVNGLPAKLGNLTRDIKLPIGKFTSGTPVHDILVKLGPAFPEFDVTQAMTDGVNRMLLTRREQRAEAQ